MSKQKVLVKKTKSIGKLKDAGEVIITLEIRQAEGEYQTVDHKKIKGYKEISLMGDVKHKNGRGMYAAGQIYDTLIKQKMRELAIPKKDFEDLIKIWKEWHLNGMNAGCEHQDSISANDKEWKIKQARETAKCPKAYIYGTAWLVKELPAKIEKRILEIFE